MKIHNLKQGTPEWHQHRANTFNASDAPAMMGVSKHKKREELLHEMATGEIKEVSDFVQYRIFDKVGHGSENNARPLAEMRIGDDLSPVTGTTDDYGLARPLGASFDGITMDYSICFEHKSMNDLIRRTDTIDELPLMYWVQMEQQLMVSGAEKCLFMATKWKGEELLESKEFWYESNTKLRLDIIAGWKQFTIDLAAYVPPVVVVEAVAEPVKDLPAVVYEMNGMSLTSNIEKVVKPAVLAQIAKYERKPETDQDFADLDAFNKSARASVKKSELLRETVMAKIVDVDKFNRDLIEIEELLTKAAISGEKVYRAENENRKNAIRAIGPKKYAEHIAALQAEIKGVRLVIPEPDWLTAGKGLKSLASLENAINTCLATAIINADSVAKDYRQKLAWCAENAAGKSSLFNDLQALMAKPFEDFCNTITLRIKEHEEAEAKRITAETERIRTEEEAKATAKAEREAAAKLAEETAKIRAEEQAKAQAKHRAKVKEELEEAAKTKNNQGDILIIQQNEYFEKVQRDTEMQNRILYDNKIAVQKGFSEPPCPTREAMIFVIESKFGVGPALAEKWLKEEFQNN